MILLTLAIIGFALACVPVLLFALNVSVFRRLPQCGSTVEVPPRISLLIPARNEEQTISEAIDGALASAGVELEIIVVDDHSDDATAERVAAASTRDPRVRLIKGPPLPPGWCGKQHACHVLARMASHDLLVWVDADVRLRPDALRRMAAEIRRRDVGLLSGFPRQRTETWLERLTISLIHFVLLGYLPMIAMRHFLSPALGAGCGQLFMAHRAEYFRAGGHAVIRASLHDGIQLPRAFRKAGIMTDLFDATDVADCRMYRCAADVWRGLMKNAREGIGSPAAIVPWTILLGGGQVLPALLVIFILARWFFRPDLYSASHLQTALVLSALAWGLSVVVRAVSALRYRQSWLGVAGHPLGVFLLLAIQWHSLYQRAVGTSPTWRGRAYPTKSIGPRFLLLGFWI